jgi:hypothetical protein
MRAFLAIGAALTVSGCVGVKFVSELPNKTATSQYVFKSALETLCVDEAYEGKLITTDAADDGFRSQRIVMGPAVCMYGIVQIPLAVGDDRSRIWQIYPTEDGFRLKHDHSHKDGTKDALTQYGGDSFGEGTGIRQIFLKPGPYSRAKVLKCRTKILGASKSGQAKSLLMKCGVPNVTLNSYLI